jgi:hypothetical protein
MSFLKQMVAPSVAILAKYADVEKVRAGRPRVIVQRFAIWTEPSAAPSKARTRQHGAEYFRARWGNTFGIGQTKASALIHLAERLGIRKGLGALPDMA